MMRALDVPVAPALAVGTVLEGYHANLSQSPRMALERRQREARLFHQVGIRRPDDRALSLFPVLGLREGPEHIEKQHITGLEADMCADAFDGHKGPCFGNCCSLACLCMLLCFRQARRYFPPTRVLVDIGHTSTVLRQACPSCSARSIVEFGHFLLADKEIPFAQKRFFLCGDSRTVRI